MKKINEINVKNLKYIFTDIDDTLTSDGRLPANSYKALWDLNGKGLKVIPVTGRPAGWCEMIARMWPVHGIVGENGGFYYCYKNKTMHRFYTQTEKQRSENRLKLLGIKKQIQAEVPKAGIASDQFCRQLDLAIDFCEDVEPLSETDINKIVDIFKAHGAQAKVSSIHINGWFGEHNKLTMCKIFFEKEFGKLLVDSQTEICFVGDSPNDEPMFEFFDNSIGVANIKNFQSSLKHPPKYVTVSEAADGFCEFANLFN